MKSLCAAWEGCLGKGSIGFCAGEDGGVKSCPGSWAWHDRGQPGSEQVNAQLLQLVLDKGFRPALPGLSPSLCPAFFPRKMVKCKVGFC